MSRLPLPQSSSLFAAIDGAWRKMADKGLKQVYRRTYLGQSLVGLIPAVIQAGKQAEIHHGFMHIPRQLTEITGEWPLGETPFTVGLQVVDREAPGGWIHFQNVDGRSRQADRELWLAWSGPEFALVITARKRTIRKRIGFVLPNVWQVSLSWHPEAVKVAMNALRRPLQDAEILLEQVHNIRKALKDLPERGDPGDQLPTLQTTLALADNIDPWTQQRLIESHWVSVMNRIQDAVAGELRAERLLPAVGGILRGTLNYDFIEIHVFTRVGKRYEEFISWRRNFTGYGDDKLSILLSEKLVATVLKERKVRIIKAERAEGIMNPHLAELAGLAEGILLPLVHRRRAHGMLMMFYRKPLNLTQQDMERIEEIGKMIAKSIEASNAHSRVHRMATMDALTNISNRRYFNEQIKKEFKRAKRYGHRLSVIMIDIDHFKHYNDSHGHLMGDRLLQQLAKVFRDNVREEDTVSRYGGEEFAIILPESDVRAGYLVAEKIRKAVLNTSFPKGDTQPLGRLTISLGVADNVGQVKTIRDLVNQSDRALYRAKEAGRNRTEIFTPELDSVS